MTTVETKNFLTLNSVRQLKFLFQENLVSKKTMKEMGHRIKKALANRITDHIGKLLRKNEELQKKKEESNGCKMKKTGDKNSNKKLRSEEQLKTPEGNKTEKTLKLELKLRNKEEIKNLKPKNKDVKNKEENGKKHKKNEDKKKKLGFKPKKSRINKDMNRLVKLLLSYKTELQSLLPLIFKKKCWPITVHLILLIFLSNLMLITMVMLQLTNSKDISLKMRIYPKLDLIFSLTTGTEDPEIDLAITNGKMDYHQMIAMITDKVSKDILDLETRDKSLFKTTHGDNN